MGKAASQRKYCLSAHGKAKKKAARKVWLQTVAGRIYAKRGRTTHQTKLRAIFTAFIREAKAHPCVDCSGSFPPCAMDFDHVRGEKLFSLSRAANKNISKCREEIAKCDLVCANCHRVRTTLRRYGKI
jgi:hypothetical protein